MSLSVEASDIRVFLVLADELHFGRTALRVGVTQSRVSQIIRHLETVLGGSLLHRTSRRVALTPLGERLRDTVTEPYRQLRVALADLQSGARGVGPTLFLGMLSQSASGGPHLRHIIDTFEAAHPACTVRLVEVSLADPLGPLRRREVDAMCLRLPLRQPDLTVGPVLSQDPRVLLVPRGHPLARCESITYEALGDFAVADVPFLPGELVADILPSHTPAGRPITRGPRTDNMSEVLAAVAAGRIVHPTARSNLGYRGHPELVGVPISDAPPTRTALITCSTEPSPAARAFTTAAQQVLARHDHHHPAGDES